MTPIKELLKDDFLKLTEKQKLNYRSAMIKEFVTILNQSRLDANYKPLHPKVYAVKMGHIQTQDLYSFLRQCQKAKSFSACWWGSLKVPEKIATPIQSYKND